MTPESQAILRLSEEADQAVAPPCSWCGTRGHSAPQCADLSAYLKGQALEQCTELKRIRQMFFVTGLFLGAAAAGMIAWVWK